MKHLELNKIGIVAITAAAVLTIGTVVLFFTLPSQRPDRYNLAFPDTAGGDIHHEWRLLPDRTGVESRAELLLKEMMLGPMALGAVPFIPQETRLNSVIFNDREHTLYIDFSTDLIVGPSADEMPFVDVEGFVTRNLTHNIRSIESIVITISGQMPEVPRFDPL